MPQSLQDAVSWLAAHPDEAPALGAPLHPSKLGTKQHWDEVSHSLRTRSEDVQRDWRQVGDQGEVWFGEDASDVMVEWVQEHVPEKNAPLLDLGTGNGQLLFRFSEEGYASLTGIDYSPSSIELAQSILSTSEQDPRPSINFFVADVLSAEPDSRLNDQGWKVLFDKGTYDAVCLNDEVDPKQGKRIGELYPMAVARLLDQGAFFLITSCNWTRAELEKAFITAETGLIFHSFVPRPSFSFGGSPGSSITTIAFQKNKTLA
ncbi:BQ2448_7464 [Microbotryum intermedium]|uniref:Protein-lysine N-methyltransferase EFM4 n=1 Tax=Microbotryum intermedium TaxID=269621 RepID=A0A238FQR3_9BASI|nr:BQ2448_7464 [Microbotryum intermedium]